MKYIKVNQQVNNQKVIVYNMVVDISNDQEKIRIDSINQLWKWVIFC